MSIRARLTTKDGTLADAANPIHTTGGAPTVTKATGSAAIALSYTHATEAFVLDAVTVHFNAAPAAAGDLTVTLDSAQGAAYDTVLARVDPSATVATDIVVGFDGGALPCEPGDAVVVAYANPSARTFGATIRTRRVG
ncbi:MAG: hypothetical protein GXY82_00810 [Methanospirillum sp.]|nr:hypothetical protein [Methanospirillum sp.]